MNYNNHIWIAELLWWIILNSSKKILITQNIRSDAELRIIVINVVF